MLGVRPVKKRISSCNTGIQPGHIFKCHEFVRFFSVSPCVRALTDSENTPLRFLCQTYVKVSGSNILSDTPQGVVNWEKRDDPLFIIISFEMV